MCPLHKTKHLSMYFRDISLEHFYFQQENEKWQKVETDDILTWKWRQTNKECVCERETRFIGSSIVVLVYIISKQRAKRERKELNEQEIFNRKKNTQILFGNKSLQQPRHKETSKGIYGQFSSRTINDFRLKHKDIHRKIPFQNIRSYCKL